ncbi:MAG: hypothetical protein QM779_05035 [Propionicimonas sp.]|uniref:hypothetical protein n=1 Tax=Propionicimonas sp. TaxID=1955623 RepID=UPI003D0A186D
MPTRWAVSCSPLFSRTSIVPDVAAAAITWSLVRMTPSARMIAPLPEPAASLPVT